jgi:hypothetical protein
MQKGVGLACLHYAVEVPKDNGGPQLLEWVGGFYERPYSQNPINDVPLQQGAPRHPITRGWKNFQSRDEWYYKIRFGADDKRVTPILTTMLPKDAPNREIVAWAVERGNGGRGFGFTGGHFHNNWGIEDQRRLVVNAILWVAKVDIPAAGAKCDVAPEDLKQNLDEKTRRPNAAAVRKEIEDTYQRALATLARAKTPEDLDAVNRLIDTPDWRSIVADGPPRSWPELRSGMASMLAQPQPESAIRIVKFTLATDTAVVIARVGSPRHIDDGQRRHVLVRDTWIRTAEGWRRKQHQKPAPGKLEAELAQH